MKKVFFYLEKKKQVNRKQNRNNINYPAINNKSY